MTSYIESNLIQGERVLHRGRPSLWGFSMEIGACVALGIATAFLVVAGAWELAALTAGITLISALLVSLLRSSIELAVTDRRVLAKTGLIRRSTSELYLSRIEGVEVEQGIFGRILGFGTIRIRGTGDQVAIIPSILEPLAFRKSVFGAGDSTAAQPRSQTMEARGRD